MTGVGLDTNVLVAATLSPLRASLQSLTRFPERRFTLLWSVPVMLEYEEVLKREEIRELSKLSLEEVDALLDMSMAVGTPVLPFFRWRPVLRDPDDDRLLELAVTGHAEAIVTLNIRDFLPKALPFGLEVLRRAWGRWATMG